MLSLAKEDGRKGYISSSSPAHATQGYGRARLIGKPPHHPARHQRGFCVETTSVADTGSVPELLCFYLGKRKGKGEGLFFFFSLNKPTSDQSKFPCFCIQIGRSKGQERQGRAFLSFATVETEPASKHDPVGQVAFFLYISIRRRKGKKQPREERAIFSFLFNFLIQTRPQTADKSMSWGFP